MAELEKPLADGAVQGAEDIQHTNNNIAETFAEVAELSIWAPFNAAKRIHNGMGNLSIKQPEHWMTLAEAQKLVSHCALKGPHLGIDENTLLGVSLVLTGPTGQGIVVDGWRLAGIDFDKVTGPITLIEQLRTYAEVSPSGKGLHVWGWVPDGWAAQHQDNAKVMLPNCHHAEIYLGSGARHLTVTGNQIDQGTAIARLDEASLGALAALLKPARVAVACLELPAIGGEGTPLGLDDYGLSPSQDDLVAGRLQPGSRSEVMHSLLLRLLDDGYAQADVLATLVNEPHLWDYFTSKRGDTAKALAFAKEELASALARSNSGLLAGLSSFNKTWAQPGAAAALRPSVVNTHTTKAKPQTFGLVSAAELMCKAGPISWLVKGYFEADTVAQIFGPPGSFKSFIALGVAVSVASGLHWHGHAVSRQGPVVYICGEGHNGLARRLMALCQVRGIGPDTLPLVFSSAAVGLSDADNAERLKVTIDALAQPPVLIVVDTLARNFGAADENSTIDMNAFIANLDALRREATVLVVHHSGHTNQERERGSSALRGAIDANYDVDDNLHVVHLTALKMKDAQLPATLYLTPRVVELPIPDEEGQHATSVVLECGEDQRAIRVAAFYREHPRLAVGNRKQYLPELFEAIYNSPEISQRAIADRLHVSSGRINELVRELRTYKLIEKAGVRLTDAGLRAAATLAGTRADIAFKVFGKTISERPEGQGESVAFQLNSGRNSRSGKAERPPVPRKRNTSGTPRGK